MFFTKIITLTIHFYYCIFFKIVKYFWVLQFHKNNVILGYGGNICEKLILITQISKVTGETLLVTIL